MTEVLYKLADVITEGQLKIPKSNPDKAVPTILTVVFAVAGAVALLIIVIGALRLVLSMGNPEGLSRARNTIIYAAVGLAVCIAAFSIVSFIVNRF